MTRHDSYWLGYQHGRRLHEHQPNENHERALRLGVKLAGNKGRAWALGELRGYRQAVDPPYVDGHTVHGLMDAYFADVQAHAASRLKP